MTDTKKLRRLLAEATPGDWELQDGSSWRRIGVYGGGDGEVLRPINHPIDHHPDLTAKGGRLYDNLHLIVALRNAAPELLDRLDKAEELLRKCGKTVFVGSLIKRADMADKIEEYFDDLTAPEETPQ